MSTEKMCTTHAFKMSFLWIYCAFVFNTQLEMVLTGQKTFGPKSLKHWRESAHGIGNGVYWFVNKDGKLYTEIQQSKKGESGESWFITQEFGKVNLSYINITALPVECGGKKSCNLIIYGTNKTISAEPVQPNRQFIEHNFERIKTVSFTQNTHGEVNVIIKKAYNRLCIVTTPTKTRTTWNIYSMKLYYNFCDQDGFDKSSLPYTNSSDGDISVAGNCLHNSVSVDGNTMITAKCSSQGKWTVDNDQKCLCNKGFGFGSSKNCSRCRIDYYKAKIADAECVKCPEGRTNNTMNTKCQCLKDHYFGEDENGPCYAVPPKVKDLEIKIHHTFVNVSWQKPLYDGGLNDFLTYGVACYHCSQSNCDKEVENAKFYPEKTNLTKTYINIFNLVKNEKYKLRVVSRNSLNLPNDKWKYAEKNFTFVPTPGPEPTAKSATLASKSPSKSTMKTKTSISTILLSVVVSILVFLLITYCGFRKCKRRYLSRKDAVELRQREFAVEQSRNNEESRYENPDELDIVLYEEIPYVVRPDENRPDMDEVQTNNLRKEQLEHQSEYANPDDNGIEPNEEGPIWTRSVLGKKEPDDSKDSQDKPSINDLVYVVPLDDQTKPLEGLIAAPEKRGTKNLDSPQSELIEDNDGYFLPADGEANTKYATPDDNEAEPHRGVPILTRSVLAAHEKRSDDPQKEPLINNLVYVIPLADQTKPQERYGFIATSEKKGTKNDDSLQSELLKDNDGYLLPADGETDPSRNAQISEPSAYAKLNENARSERDIVNAGNYQKLLKRDSDYGMPADGERDPTQNVQILHTSAYAQLNNNGQSERDTENANGEADSTQNEQIIELSPYAKLNRNKTQDKDTENIGVYQKLLKRDSDDKRANDS